MAGYYGGYHVRGDCGVVEFVGVGSGQCGWHDSCYYRCRQKSFDGLLDDASNIMVRSLESVKRMFA